MIKKEELELIEFKLTEDGIDIVSIVSDPAIEQSFQLFNSIKKNEFKSIEDKQEITGPVMVPNKAILRQDMNGKFFNCWFSENTIKECASIYLEHCNHLRANFEHQKNSTNDIVAIESWIVSDPENDKSNALGFKDVQKGTWFMTYKVKNKELWDNIKKSGFTGFSIEGFFSVYSKINKDDSKTKNYIYSILISNLNDSDKESLIRRIYNTLD